MVATWAAEGWVGVGSGYRVTWLTHGFCHENCYSCTFKMKREVEALLHAYINMADSQ